MPPKRALPLLLVVFFSACTKIQTISMKNAFPQYGPAPTGQPILLLPVTETFEQKKSTAAYQNNANHLGKVLNNFFGYGPLPIIPLIVKYDQFVSDIPRTEIVRNAAKNQLAAKGLATEDGQADASGQPLNLPSDRMALSLRLRSYELDAKLGFLTLLIDSGFWQKDVIPKARLDCRVWRGGNSAPMFEGVVEAVCTGPCMSERTKNDPKIPGKSNPRTKYAEVVAAAVDDCIEKSGMLASRKKLVEQGYSDVMSEASRAENSGRARRASDLYIQAYRSADTLEQTLEALRGIARTNQGSEVPEEAKDLMAKGKAAVAMARNAGDYVTACNNMEKAVALAPWWASGHYNTALAEEGAGRWAAGIKHMRAYLALRPDADDKERVRTKIAELELHLERGDLPPQ